jgi:hypothetical protein
MKRNHEARTTETLAVRPPGKRIPILPGFWGAYPDVFLKQHVVGPVLVALQFSSKRMNTANKPYNDTTETISRLDILRISD